MTARQAGEVTEWPWKDGTTITYGARFRAYGKRHRETWGTNTQGWSRTRAEIKLEEILQQIDRGTWVPPTKKTTSWPTAPALDDGHQLFGPFAREIVEAKKLRGLGEKTLEDLDWRLGYLEADLGRHELLEIDVALIDRFRDDLAKRSRVILQAQARGKPLMETIRQPGKRPYQRPKRTLSNSSINMILSLAGQIMQRAVEYKHVPVNPLRVGSHKDRFLPAEKPRRSFLEIDELNDALDAARELDDHKRLDQRLGRHGALGALALAGFRVSELCGLQVWQVDLERARFKLVDAKTPKGIREVEMTAWLQSELLRHRDQRIADGIPMGPNDYFFGTHLGSRRDPNGFRRSILRPTIARANENRTENGLPTLPKITPHSLRRTWAMLAAQAGRDPQWISDQIGHDSAAFTLSVYQQTRHRRHTKEERQTIWELMRFADEPEQCPLVR